MFSSFTLFLDYQQIGNISHNFEKIVEWSRKTSNTYNVGETLLDTIDFKVDPTKETEALSHCFGALRRNKSLLLDVELPKESPNLDLSGSNCVLILFTTGNCCVVFSKKFTDTEDVENFTAENYFQQAFPIIRTEINRLLKRSPLEKILAPSLKFRTSIHRFFLLRELNPSTISFGKRLFDSEGLELCQDEGELSFCSGWSNSIYFGSNNAKGLLFLTVMIRYQIYWHHIRKVREETLALHGQLSVSNKLHGIERFRKKANFDLFQLQISKQSISDFHSNLKPWLKTYSEKVSALWSLEDDYQSIATTLERQREFSQFILFDESLSQNRIQSFLLYFIAALDTLAISALTLDILSFERNKPTNINWLSNIMSDEALNFVLLINISLLFLIVVLGILRRFFK